MKSWTTDEGYEIVEASPYYTSAVPQRESSHKHQYMGAFGFHMQEDIMRPSYYGINYIFLYKASGKSPWNNARRSTILQKLLDSKDESSMDTAELKKEKSWSCCSK